MAQSKKITKEKYLEVVRKYRTTINNEVAQKLGVHRSNVGRFLKANPKLKDKAKKMIAELDRVQFTESSVMDVEVFKQIPIVSEWVATLERGDMKPKGLRNRLFSLMRVCNALGVHPSKLDLDNVADNVMKWKNAQANGLPYPRGCSYSSVRRSLRSFFTIQLGVTAKVLTIKGIGAEHSKGFGQSAREKLSLDERLSIIREMRYAVEEIFKEEGVNTEHYPINDYVIEMFGVCFFMYYTATRIDATINATLNDSRNVFTHGYYEIHITDKGRGARIEWQKRLKDNAYDLMASYIEERFEISKEEQPKMLKSIDSYLFPLLQKNYELETKVMKRVQQITGSYKIIQVNHLWRHTFAQDWLESAEGNYEVGAEIGGWKDIGTMKRCYGAVSETIIQRGLDKAMGLPVIDSTYELRFTLRKHDDYINNMIKSRGVA